MAPLSVVCVGLGMLAASGPAAVAAEKAAALLSAG
eukprot:CAMPEP_0172744260 /NCGR_PEP_ID=MMETSP1074-20121228/134725_1 /TAXON_ID=2916 /ORGANISM="Ceratium fusus, Strain PA161109" /LENGTH=34 /DNA_ID= /DNA_START= /DNA_END= /DNA_ORIENTATION=